jgi:hypothetical protein
MTPEPTDDDLATCTGCGRTIFRTNVDGRWHHPGRNIDHDPVPDRDRRVER